MPPSPQIIRTDSGEELVVLTRQEYEELIGADLDEDAADAAVYRERKAELAAGRDSLLPAEVSAALLRGERLLRALRRWRGKTQQELAAATCLAQGYLSEIENGAKTGSDDTLARIATALDIPQGWLVPAS